MEGHIILLVFAILVTAFLIGLIIWGENKPYDFTKETKIFSYISLIFISLVLWCGYFYECGKINGAYNQMRGKYKITYKTTTITNQNCDTETQKTDTIIQVF